MAKILVIEDSLVDAHRILLPLTKEGYAVDHYETPTKALENIEASIPDIIFMDIMMPDMDGYELLSRLKKIPAVANVPVIIMTSRTEDYDADYAAMSGANLFIRKPIKKEDLSNILSEVLL